MQRVAKPKPDRNWLFGREAGGGELTAGALQFGEARLLAFPVRSARGSFAWLTCPLLLARAVRDGVLDKALIPPLTAKVKDDEALFLPDGPLALGGGQPPKTQVVIEEYVFTLPCWANPVPADRAEMNSEADTALKKLAEKGLLPLLPGDEVWQEVATRLVVVSDGMMSFFATNACEVAQHVTIDDATGTAKNTGLFNQENVPSETLFYAVLHPMKETGKQLKNDKGQPRQPCTAEQAVAQFWPDHAKTRVFQFGADASTGLGYCTVRLATPATPVAPPPGNGTVTPATSDNAKAPTEPVPAAGQTEKK
jgi:CRISPR-associated protein Cmr4